MAPTIAFRISSGEHIHQMSRSISFLESRSTESSTTPVTSIFALVGRKAIYIVSRALEALSRTSYVSSRSAAAATPFQIVKRQSNQDAILAIPTTYAGLNDGPAPGAVVGIVLGSVGGFLLALFLLYSILRLSGRFSTTIVEEEVIRRRSRSPRRSRSRSETIEIRSEHRSPVAPSRRESRRVREEIIVEERISPEPPPDDDIVEVIEEHSPERRQSRRESKRMSGFRTVDPAEFGGGDRPMRRVSKR